jgi:hypothetical protein
MVIIVFALFTVAVVVEVSNDSESAVTPANVVVVAVNVFVPEIV